MVLFWGNCEIMHSYNRGGGGGGGGDDNGQYIRSIDR
jgi:hypothetical protein